MDIELIAITMPVGAVWGDDVGVDEVLVKASKICVGSKATGMTDDQKRKYIQDRIAEGHVSVIEHGSATFRVTGISRACSQQLERHRLASYSEMSQRHVDMALASFVTPPDVAADADKLAVWNEAIASVKSSYRRLRRMGVKKEDARFILPMATETQLIFTMNFRELRHFFTERLSDRAQWEIRELATECLKIISRFTICFDDMKERN